jgi:hypothetical protein
VSKFADFANLRVGMPVAALQRLLPPGAAPAADGWLRIGSVKARIGLDGHIGTLEFYKTFPSNISVSGLHIGMTLDELVKDERQFQPMKRVYPFHLSPYAISPSPDETITAKLANDGIVHYIEITRPGAVYPAINYVNAPSYSVRLRDYPDNAELLADWVASYTLSPYYARLAAEAHWLQHDSKPGEWHRYVHDHNWDFGEDPLLWIIRQPGCEKATALLAFYMSRPGQLLDHAFDASKMELWEHSAFDLIVEIRDRFLAGAFTASTIAFDAERALADEAYLPEDPDEAAFDHLIPPPMRISIPGREIDMAEDPAIPLRPELFTRPISTLRPPPLTGEEQAEIERVLAQVAARKAKPNGAESAPQSPVKSLFQRLFSKNPRP